MMPAAARSAPEVVAGKEDADLSVASGPQIRALPKDLLAKIAESAVMLMLEHLPFSLGHPQMLMLCRVSKGTRQAVMPNGPSVFHATAHAEWAISIPCDGTHSQMVKHACGFCDTVYQFMLGLKAQYKLGRRAVFDFRSDRNNAFKVLDTEIERWTITELRSEIKRSLLCSVDDAICVLGDTSDFAKVVFGRGATAFANTDFVGLFGNLLSDTEQFRPLLSFTDAAWPFQKQAVHAFSKHSMQSAVERLNEESIRQGGSGIMAADLYVYRGCCLSLASTWSPKQFKSILSRSNQHFAAVGFCVVACRHRPIDGDSVTIEDLMGEAAEELGFNVLSDADHDGRMTAKYLGTDIVLENKTYAFRQTDTAAQMQATLIDLRTNLAISYGSMSARATDADRHKRQIQLVSTYGTALSQIMYTSGHEPFEGGEDLNNAPGHFQLNAYWWMMIPHDTMEEKFPKTFARLRQ